MFASRVVEHFDVGEDFGLGVVVGGEGSATQHFGLERADEAFSSGGAGGHALGSVHESLDGDGCAGELDGCGEGFPEFFVAGGNATELFEFVEEAFDLLRSL